MQCARSEHVSCNSSCAQHLRETIPEQIGSAKTRISGLQKCLVDASDTQVACGNNGVQKGGAPCEVDEADQTVDDPNKNNDVFPVTVHLLSGDVLLIPDLRKGSLVEDLFKQLCALRPLRRGEVYQVTQGHSVLSKHQVVDGDCFNVVVRNCLGPPWMREHCGDDLRASPQVTFAEEEAAFIEPPVVVDPILQQAVARGLRSVRNRIPTAFVPAIPEPAPAEVQFRIRGPLLCPVHDDDYDPFVLRGARPYQDRRTSPAFGQQRPEIGKVGTLPPAVLGSSREATCDSKVEAAQGCEAPSSFGSPALYNLLTTSSDGPPCHSAMATIRHSRLRVGSSRLQS